MGSKIVTFARFAARRITFAAWAPADAESRDEFRACVIVRRGGKFCLLTRDRSRTLGCHATHREAAAQEAAIEISKAKARHGADWDESKHPRVPAGEPNGGEFAGVEFPFADDTADVPVEHRITDQQYDQIHELDVTEDPDERGRLDAKFKKQLSQKLGFVLDDEFDGDKLNALAGLISTHSEGSPGYAVSTAFVDGWAMSSGDTNAMSILYQHAANEAAGADGVLDHLAGYEFDEILAEVNDELGLSSGESHGLTANDVYDMMRVHARAQYESTQKELTKRGITSVALFRGVALGPTDADTIARTGLAALQPISSFSSSRAIALDFTNGTMGGGGEWGNPANVLTHGHLLRATFPASRVFSLPKTGFGCLAENEWVILGTRSTKVRISKRYGKFNKAKTQPFTPTYKPIPDAIDEPTFVPFLGRSAKYNPDEPRVPKGDEDGGQWTAISGRATRGEMRPATSADRKRLAIPPAYTDALVTDDPGAELVATARTPKGKLASFYSGAYHDKQAAAKWARIQQLQEDLPGMLERVNHDIAHATDDRDVAMTIRLIAQTGLRNGGDAGEGVGASNLLLNHATLVGGNKVRLQFKGKGGVAQDHTVDDRTFAAYVRERQKSSTDGRLFPHDAADTLEYQKKIGAGRYKVHDLRTHVGTTMASKLAQEVIAKGLAPTTDKEHKAVLKQIAMHVSKRLGNTPAIALSTYIHPSAVAPLKPKYRKAA